MRKILLFISAFIPLYFLVIIKIFIDIIFGNLSFNFLNTATILTLSFAILLGIKGIKISISKDKTKAERIIILQKTSITQQYFLGYFSLFVLFALGFELEKVSMFIVFILVIVLIGIVYIKNDLFYINPFLNIIGYNFYDIKFKYEGKNEISNAKFFYKGKLELNKKTYKVKFSHENFSQIL